MSSLDFEFFSGDKLQEKRRRLRKLRRELGEKKLWKGIKGTKGRERNYIKDQNHKISRAIVDMASEHENSVIVMEELDGIRKHMDWLRKMNWKDTIGRSESFRISFHIKLTTRELL